MKNVLLIHGGDAYSKREDFLTALRSQELRAVGKERPARWSDNLATDLGSAYQVLAPAMPNSENAQYDEWSIWFERHLALAGLAPIVIGWSLGGMFLAKYIAENQVTFEKLFLLGAPCGSYEDETGNDCGSFQFDEAVLGELSGKVGEIHIFHSEDDFVVPYEHALKYQAALPAAKLHTFTDKNHFLVPELPELIDLIKKT